MKKYYKESTKMRTKTNLIVLIASLFLVTKVFGGAAAGGASEVTQILNNTQLVMQYAKQVEQYTTQLSSLSQQIQQTQAMLQNLQQLSPSQWSMFSRDLVQLKNLVQQSQGVTFAASNLDSQFSAMYPGYDSQFSSAGQSYSARNTTFSNQYKNINASTRANTNGALKSLNLQMEDFTSDDETMATLQAQSQSADGQMKVAQAANEIALHQTEENKKLRWTLMTQASTEAAWIAAQNEKETAQQALSERRGEYTKPSLTRTPTPSAFENFPH